MYKENTTETIYLFIYLFIYSLFVYAVSSVKLYREWCIMN